MRYLVACDNIYRIISEFTILSRGAPTLRLPLGWEATNHLDQSLDLISHALIPSTVYGIQILWKFKGSLPTAYGSVSYFPSPLTKTH